MLRNNLAGVLQYMGDDEATRQELQIIIELQTHLAGQEHWRTGTAHRSLGYFLLKTGNPGAAMPELQAAHDNFANGLGADHLWTAATAMQIAICLHQLGDEPGADEMWQKVRPILDTKPARDDRNVRLVLQKLLELTDAGDSPWSQRLSDLVVVESQGDQPKK